jgi:hypothetical protein
MATKEAWPGAVHPRILIDAVVKEAVAPVLRGAGFSRRSRTWRRRPTPAVTQVLNLQASPWNAVARDYVERTSASFTLNLGLHVAGVDEIIGWTLMHSVPLENECHVQLRVGNLLEDGCDHWWRMETERDVPSVAENVSDVLRGVVLPWFDAHSSVAAVRRWFDDPPQSVLVLTQVSAALDALLDSDADGDG